MSKEMNMRPDGLIWGKWKVDDRFYVLTNQWENFCYLLIGDEKALLLDAGYEWDGDLRAVVEEITDLPVMVVLTHGHLDHAGQIYWWDECWCGEGAEHDYEITVDPEQYASWKSKLGENFVWHILEDGEVIDIGGNEFEVIRVTAHAKSGLMLIDRKRRILFSGDQIDPSQVLLFCNDEITTKEAIEIMLSDTARLMERTDEFDRIYPAHNGIAISNDYIRDYYILAKQLSEGTATMQPTPGGFKWPNECIKGHFIEKDWPVYRAQYGLASAIMKE